MPRSRQSNPSPRANNAGMVVVIAALALLLIGCTAYLAWQRQQQQTLPPPAQTADLISDDRIIYGGMPRARPGAGSEVAFEVLKNDAYISAYSESRRDPLWVTYRVFHNPQPFHLPRPTGGFVTDTRTHARVKDSDYARSGYDRGHMAPNSAIATYYGAEAQIQTFLLSNICPQTPLLNQKVWERLEADEHKYTDQLEEVWIIDGPIFADLNGGQTSKLASGIAIPSSFFKILIDEQDHPGGKPRVFSVIMPQDVKGTELPQQYLTTISEIEKQTHLEFLWKLDPTTRADLENTRYPMW